MLFCKHTQKSVARVLLMGTGDEILNATSCLRPLDEVEDDRGVVLATRHILQRHIEGEPDHLLQHRRGRAGAD